MGGPLSEKGWGRIGGGGNWRERGETQGMERGRNRGYGVGQ